MVSYDIPESLDTEIDDLEARIEKTKLGELTPAELKMHRVPFGVYEQRIKGNYMVRIRSTAGIVTPSQLGKIAELAKKYGSGIIHATTRQEFQIHDVPLDNLIPIIRELKTVGLSTRGGGGNTVRNVTASWDSGVAKDEIFDVTPHAIALTTRLIANADSWILPRKYKISFSNSAQDNSLATINDLGFIATIENGQNGFKVFVAGGMGRQSQPGHLLHEFLPESDVFITAEAIKRLFSKNGNRKNKHSARLRFLWNTLGRDKFIVLYEKEKQILISEGHAPSVLKPIENNTNPLQSVVPIQNSTQEFTQWRRRFSIEQKQAGLFSITVPLQNGLLNADQASALAEALVPFGQNVLRLTQTQNLSFRNIPENYLGNIFEIVKSVTDLWKYAPIIGNALACAGANTCQLGICLARGALNATIEKLKSTSVELDSLGNFKIHLSGCPNTCGQHSIADLGFYGKVSRKDQKSYPSYAIVAGAQISANGSRLAEKIDDISARDLPSFTEELLSLYINRKDTYDSFHSYLIAEGKDEIKRIVDKYRDIPSFTVDSTYYQDWGAEEIFSVAGRGTGECSAGLFDMVEFDQNQIDEYIKEAEQVGNFKALYKIALLSSRMLLITRGVEAHSDEEVFNSFETEFIKSGLVNSKFREVLDIAKKNQPDSLVESKDAILDLATTVKVLYVNMDNSLQFKTSDIKQSEAISLQKRDIPRREKDLRGVVCPMNFVKVKLELSSMHKGELLTVLLDDGQPIENVPRSIAEEGQEIVRQERVGSYWSVDIRKAI